MSRVRDAGGRFANGFARTADAMLRSGADMHGRTFLDAPEPLSKMGAPEADPDGEKFLYAVAVRAVVRWSAGERPTRHVEVEYVDPAREHVVVREVPGRLGSTGGRVRVESVKWDAVPRRIAVARGERRALDADSDEHAAYGDVLYAHEAVRR